MLPDSAFEAVASVGTAQHYPSNETGYDLATSHPKIQEWLKRISELPNWKFQYDLLPGKRLHHYV